MIVSNPCLSESIFFKVIVKSSACCTLFISFVIFGSENPQILSFSLIFIAKTSATRMYKRAEKGHPCLIPRCMLTVLDSHPLFLVRKIGFVYITFTHFIKFWPKLNLLRVLYKKFHSIESNAFSKSRKSNMPSW